MLISLAQIPVSRHSGNVPVSGDQPVIGYCGQYVARFRTGSSLDRDNHGYT